MSTEMMALYPQSQRNGASSGGKDLSALTAEAAAVSREWKEMNL